MKIQELFNNISLTQAAQNPKEIISSLCAAIGSRKVIIYGAAWIGEVVLNCLTELDINVAHVVDRDAKRIGHIQNTAVESPDILHTLKDRAQEYIVIIAVSEKMTVSVLENLKTIGCSLPILTNGKKISHCLQAVICTLDHINGNEFSFASCGDCILLNNTCPALRQRALEMAENKNKRQCVKNIQKSKDSVFIGYVLGNICNLNCEFCFESISLFEDDDKKFVETSAVVNDIQRIADVSECITLIEFIGGEPFLHKGLPDIIKACLEIPNAVFIKVFTNGTILPSAELARALSHPRVSVFISNYSAFLDSSQTDNVEKTKNILAEHGVLYTFGREMKWYNMSNYALQNEAQEALAECFVSCKARTCNRVYDGVMYLCPHHYTGTMLGKFPESNTIQIHKLTDNELVTALDNFKRQAFIEACRYCVCNTAPMVNAGNQK